MTNQEFSFDVWFDVLQSHVLDRTGVDFRDRDSVRGDYDAGADVFDVIDDICAEYGEEDYDDSYDDDWDDDYDVIEEGEEDEE